MKGGKTWAERAPMMRSSACHTERTAGGTTGGHARPGRSLVKTEARPEKLSPQQPRLSAGSSVPSVSSSLKRKDSFALNWLSKNKDFIIRYLWHCLSTPSVAICLPQMMDRMCVKCQRFPGHTGFPSPWQYISRPWAGPHFSSVPSSHAIVPAMRTCCSL